MKLRGLVVNACRVLKWAGILVLVLLVAAMAVGTALEVWFIVGFPIYGISRVMGHPHWVAMLLSLAALGCIVLIAFSPDTSQIE